MKKIVYSVIETQTNDNGNLYLYVHSTHNELARAKEDFATIYKKYASDHIPQEFSSAMMDRGFTCVSNNGGIYKLVRLVESEVI